MAAWLLCAFSLLWVTISAQTNQECPWNDPDLERWSEPGTWSSGRIPQYMDRVIIPADKKILLDGPIPRLLSLTIDGTLVWGNVDNIRMETSYVLVHGEFHIGSEDCRFEKNADIFLYGKSNSTNIEEVEEFGRKFIGASSGSKLEFHGKRKLSWTKLIETVKPGCEPLYDSKSQNGPMRGRSGISLTVWRANGTIQSFATYRVGGAKTRRALSSLVNRLKRVPDGRIVSVAVFRSIGNPQTARLIYDRLYRVIESLGGKNIRNVGEQEPYALVAETGRPDCAIEKHMQRSEVSDSGLESVATYPHGDLVFQATSFSDSNRANDDVIFKVMTREAAFPKLSFLHDVTSWKPGDEVVVTSTDYDWRQYEVKVIVPCRECQANQIRVNGGFRFLHFGQVTYGVDERAEVGLLSRNIRVSAELQSQCYNNNDHEKYLCDLFNRDTFGGHLKVLRDAWVRIEGVELRQMGQQAELGRYPLHFHLCDAVPGQYVRNNVIRDSNSRCITVHATDYLEVSENVCLNHLGHGIFLEDSAEQNNTIHRNLVIGTQHGTLLFSDRDSNWCKERHYCGDLGSYWITHPNNFFTDNVAAGSDATGFVFSFADRPLGPSLQRMKERGLYREYSTRYTKVAQFTGNVMHSNQKSGLWFDSRISSGEMDGKEFVPENAILGLNYYSPRENADPTGKLVESVLSGLTLYKNQDRNTWIRCGNIVIVNSSFADSPASYVAAHTVDGTSCEVRNSIFIGETENKGEPFTYTFSTPEFQRMNKQDRPKHTFDRSIGRGHPDFMISGVQFYQGPVYLHGCYFDQYHTWYYNDSLVNTLGFRPVRPAAALTFHPNNHYPMVPRNGVSGLKFGFCDGVDNSFRVMDGNSSTPWWQVLDGTGNTLFRDNDGSLTGTANTQIVQDRPFFTGLRCLKKPDWGLSVCPYKYFWLVLRGKTGALHSRYKGKTPILIRRDDQPQDVYAQTGKTSHKYNLRVFKSYTIYFNASVAPAPRDLQFRPRFGLEKNEVVRFAVCLPKSTTNFTIYSKLPELHPKKNLLPVWVPSLKQLDRDRTMKAFYWDRTNGYLYFKMKSPHSLERPGQLCPGDVCLEVNINRDDGGDEPAVCDAPVRPYVVKDRAKRVRAPSCSGPQSSQGMGAPIETGFAPPPPSSDKCA